MAKVYSDGEIPKHILEGCVNYDTEYGHIIRGISGFTTEALLNDPKYAKSWENANEFGAVSQLCKAIRMILQEGLPKSKNLEVTNGLHTIMRKVMCCDTISQRGNRCLKNGFASAGGNLCLQAMILILVVCCGILLRGTIVLMLGKGNCFLSLLSPKRLLFFQRVPMR